MLYLYLAASPPNRRDPLGLFTNAELGAVGLLRGALNGRELTVAGGLVGGLAGAGLLSANGEFSYDSRIAQSLWDALEVFTAEEAAGAQEGWNSPEEAVPWEEAARDGMVKLERVGSEATKDERWIGRGFTETEYYRVRQRESVDSPKESNHRAMDQCASLKLRSK